MITKLIERNQVNVITVEMSKTSHLCCWTIKKPLVYAVEPLLQFLSFFDWLNVKFENTLIMIQSLYVVFLPSSSSSVDKDQHHHNHNIGSGGIRSGPGSSGSSTAVLSGQSALKSCFWSSMV